MKSNETAIVYTWILFLNVCYILNTICLSVVASVHCILIISTIWLYKRISVILQNKLSSFLATWTSHVLLNKPKLLNKSSLVFLLTHSLEMILLILMRMSWSSILLKCWNLSYFLFLISFTSLLHSILIWTIPHPIVFRLKLLAL
jgi:hypothetical protein